MPQVTFHLDGVGSGRGTGWLARATDHVLGGLFGEGLMATIEAAYRFLVLAYAPGDEIHLFGFSRGAFTARSLAGLIRNCGILERAHAAAIPEALALYRSRGEGNGPDSEAALAFRARYSGHVITSAADTAWRQARGALPADAVPLRLRYLGVWDTVGALGVPGHLWLARLLNRGLGFHDTSLSGAVRSARHAVAIDERRRTFPPTLWDNLAALNAAADGAPYRQAWFPGDHGSVGGGGAVTVLSNEALVWVAEGALAAGLALDPAAVAAWRQGRDCFGPLNAQGGTPSLPGRLLALDCRDRAGPERIGDLARPARHRWQGDPGYRPPTLAQVAAALGAAGVQAGPLSSVPVRG